MPKHQNAHKQLTFMYSNNEATSVATHKHMTYILTSAEIDPLDIPELEGLLPSSAYTLQLLLKDNSEPLLLVGEQHPDKSLKNHHVWDFFGGGVHPHEDARDAALRERIEESGITIKIAPYLEPVIYVVFDEDGQRCAKAFYFSTLNYAAIKEHNFVKHCKAEINKAADGRFELISLATLKVSDFFAQISPNNGKDHDAHLESMRLILQDHPLKGLHNHNTWRNHVPELLGNTAVQDLILQIIQNFVPQMQTHARATLSP